jgi:trimethylamine:corrinoid methyltransferase-like protein
MLEMGITCDYGKLVMDNEFAGMIKKAVTGIPVSFAIIILLILRRLLTDYA